MADGGVGSLVRRNGRKMRTTILQQIFACTIFVRIL